MAKISTASSSVGEAEWLWAAQMKGLVQVWMRSCNPAYPATGSWGPTATACVSGDVTGGEKYPLKKSETTTTSNDSWYILGRWRLFIL